ncbi:hypothetical protein [Dyella jiangningensis]|uniref:Lipoprotein n=1 Tax=Dyella jiangningensis TaxID=1379159 RepID=A0A328P1S2_9GAMM|nr:hypothetical protein [Dyella jiangningensis]RAO74505.1 hypothetical protein CA260_20745 [Dyella jiangningensis]
MYFSSRLFMLCACLSLSACAGKPTVLDQDKLQSLSLYDADNHARFTVYVSCEAADDLSDSICLRTQYAFSDWASDRKIVLSPVDTKDALFTKDELEARRLPAPSTAKPYVMAIYFNPEVTPSFGAMFDGAGAVSVASNSRSARIGYKASIRIFDTASGKLIEQIPSHETINVKPQTNGAPYVRAVVADLVANLDPSYDADRPKIPRR